jgi:hypothetical protein
MIEWASMPEQPTEEISRYLEGLMLQPVKKEIIEQK